MRPGPFVISSTLPTNCALWGQPLSCHCDYAHSRRERGRCKWQRNKVRGKLLCWQVHLLNRHMNVYYHFSTPDLVVLLFWLLWEPHKTIILHKSQRSSRVLRGSWKIGWEREEAPGFGWDLGKRRSQNRGKGGHGRTPKAWSPARTRSTALLKAKRIGMLDFSFMTHKNSLLLKCLFCWYSPYSLDFNSDYPLNFVCELEGRYPGIWFNIILCRSVKGFLDEINICICRMSKANYPRQCRWSSSNHLKAW